jgi:hypothetical protein
MTPSTTPTAMPTVTPTPTFTPSLTITNTITPTFTLSPTPTVDAGLLGELARLGAQATILPLEQRFPPPTLTALALTALALIPTPTSPFAPPPSPGAVACLYPPPAGLASLFAADLGLQSQLGCPIGQPPAPVSVTTAAQVFERGAMAYVQDAQGYIYSLSNDGRFRRFDDTFVAGVDPERGGESPPNGLLEPVRGFGEVWRNNPDVRSALGWATAAEIGATSTLQAFERGRVISLPQLSALLILIEDPGGATGSWRLIPGSF